MGLVNMWFRAWWSRQASRNLDLWGWKKFALRPCRLFMFQKDSIKVLLKRLSSSVQEESGMMMTIVLSIYEIWQGTMTSSRIRQTILSTTQVLTLDYATLLCLQTYKQQPWIMITWTSRSFNSRFRGGMLLSKKKLRKSKKWQDPSIKAIFGRLRDNGD